MAEFSEQELHAITRAIGDPRRFEILQHIAAKPCMACSDLRTEFPISAATLSHHLRELESAGLIEIERRGKFVDAKFRPRMWNRYLTGLKRVMRRQVRGVDGLADGGSSAP